MHLRFLNSLSLTHFCYLLCSLPSPPMDNGRKKNFSFNIEAFLQESASLPGRYESRSWENAGKVDQMPMLLPRPKLVAVPGRLKEATSRAGATWLTVRSGPCSYPMPQTIENWWLSPESEFLASSSRKLSESRPRSAEDFRIQFSMKYAASVKLLCTV